MKDKIREIVSHGIFCCAYFALDEVEKRDVDAITNQILKLKIKLPEKKCPIILNKFLRFKCTKCSKTKSSFLCKDKIRNDTIDETARINGLTNRR